MEYQSPLAWPLERPRTQYRHRARFQVTPDATRKDLERELRLMGATHAIVSSNMDVGRSGVPFAAQRGVTDPGVALYFTWEGEDYCVPCDLWDLVWDNLRAIGKHVEAIRGISRWTGAEAVKQAFAGFAALPEGATSGVPWWDVLGVEPGASTSEIHRRYLSLVKEHHPDSGGSPEKMYAINQAWRQAQDARALS